MPNIILLIVSFAMFMEAVDTTIINTAIPAMARSLQINPLDLKLALISYLVSLAIFIPISGWIADKFGIKKVFITALGIFTLSSMWCGFTNNLNELVIARILQGIGGSLTMPVGRLIIVRTFKRHELITQMSHVVMVAALGMMLGPVLGGLITHYFSWRWIFWVNVPVGLLAMVMAKIWLKPSPPEHVPPLDKLGFVLFGVGLAALTLGLSSLSETGMQDMYCVIIFMIAVVSLTWYGLHSRRRKHPIVKTELLKFRTFQVSVTGNLFARLGFGGVPFLVPLLLQIGLGYSPQVSGMLLAPTALGVLLNKPFSLYFLRLFGFKRLLLLNTFLVGLSLWSFMMITQDTSLYFIGFLTFIFGFLMSLQYSGMNSLAYADIPHENLSSATSIMGTLQQLAQSFGVAVGALLVRFYTPEHLAVLTPSVFHYTFFTMGFITFFSMLVFIRLQPKDGYTLIKKMEEVAPL